MLIRAQLTAVSLLLAAACGAPAADPQPEPAKAPLTAQEIVAKTAEFNAALPAKMEDKITTEREAKAAEACAFFQQAAGQADKLDDGAKINLGRLGMMAGFSAGDAPVMGSGAKMMWSAMEPGNAKRIAAIAVSWAGIFGGDPKLANEGLDSILKDPPGRNWEDFVATLRPVAATCDKRVNLDIRLLNGKVANSANLKGKAVTLDFWASWCGPCIQSTPIIQKYYDQRKDDGNFVLISLSWDRRASDALRGIREHKMTWHQAMDPDLSKKFGIGSIPHMVVLSADGRMIYRGHPRFMSRIEWATDFSLRQARYLDAKAKPAKDGQAGKTESAPTPPLPAAERPAPTLVRPPQTPEELAEQKYRMAMAYRQAGMDAKAADLLRAIVKDYPDTTVAAKVKAELDK